MEDSELIESFQILWQNSDVQERSTLRELLELRFGFHKSDKIISRLQEAI